MFAGAVRLWNSILFVSSPLVVDGNEDDIIFFEHVFIHPATIAITSEPIVATNIATDPIVVLSSTDCNCIGSVVFASEV